MVTNQDMIVVLPTTDGESKILQMYAIARRQQNSMKAFACLPLSSKVRLPSRDHLESYVCLVRHLNFDSFFGKTLSMDIVLACC